MLFDSLSYVKMMKESGFDQEQSEAVISIWSEIVKEELASKRDLSAVEAALKADLSAVEIALKADLSAVEIALKADLSAVEIALKSDLKLLKTDVKAELKILEQRMTIKFGSMLTAAVVLIVTLQKIL